MATLAITTETQFFVSIATIFSNQPRIGFKHQSPYNCSLYQHKLTFIEGVLAMLYAVIAVGVGCRHGASSSGG